MFTQESKLKGSISGLPSSRYWIVGNVQEVGFYKVNYDEHNWKLLIHQLMDDHTKIHTINRAQIIDDSMDLARAGHISYHLAMNTTMYLKKEVEYLPWESALKSFSQIDYMIRRSVVYRKGKKYIMDQLKPLYETLGWEESSDETISKHYLRMRVIKWMCRYGHKDCVKQAQEKYDQWKEDPSNVDIIPPKFREIVFCIAVKYGGEEVWNFLWERYKTQKVPSEKFIFIRSLTCATEPWLLTRYLNWSLNSDSELQRLYGSYVFRSLGDSLYGQDLTFNYIQEKWGIIADRYGIFELTSLLKSVTSSFNTWFELEQLEELYKREEVILRTIILGADILETLKQSVENVKANVRWMDNNYIQLEDWLEMTM